MEIRINRVRINCSRPVYWASKHHFTTRIHYSRMHTAPAVAVWGRRVSTRHRPLGADKPLGPDPPRTCTPRTRHPPGSRPPRPGTPPPGPGTARVQAPPGPGTPLWTESQTGGNDVLPSLPILVGNLVKTGDGEKRPFEPPCSNLW